MSKAKLEFESFLVNDFAFSNSNRIFKYESFSKNDLIPATMCYNDKCRNDNFGIAQMFNYYFYSVFTRETSSCSKDFEHTQSANILNTIVINTPEVFEALISLDPKKLKAMGIDKINPKVLKYCATSLSEPSLSHIFILSALTLAIFLREW